MLIRNLESRAEFKAGDGTILREILRPEEANVAIRYSLAHARLPAMQASQQHRLSSTEVYYILEGAGIMQIDGERQEVGPGDCIYIPPSAVQHIENMGSSDLVFLCVVDPAWRKEDEEVL
ncbi:MAG: cupin domain-containing protein [Chloroflexia bacterium]